MRAMQYRLPATKRGQGGGGREGALQAAGSCDSYASASQYCPRAAHHAATGRAAMHTPGAHSCVWGLEKAVPENKDAGKAFGAALVVRVKKKVI